MDFVDFKWISWISNGFQDFPWISRDFWISGWISVTLYEISRVSDPSVRSEPTDRKHAVHETMTLKWLPPSVLSYVRQTQSLGPGYSSSDCPQDL